MKGTDVPPAEGHNDTSILKFTQSHLGNSLYNAVQGYQEELIR